MTNFFKRLLEPTTNAPEVAELIVKLIKAKISKTTLKKEIEEHPDYPSLLSISDVFTSQGIENIALRIDPATLTETSNPFIVQLNGDKKDEVFFSVVREIKNNMVTFYDPVNHVWMTLDKDNFVKKITGIVLLVGEGDDVYERDYDKKIKAEKRQSFIQYAGIFTIPVLSIALGIFYYFQIGVNVIFPFIYMLLTIIGCGIATLLIWYELDRHNPALNQICSAGKKINCGAVLQSDASKIAGFSWSSIGFSYFASLLILLIFGGFDNNVVLYMLSWGSILAMPYLVFSVYYQWRVAKQWCVLCLSVLVVLILQLTVSSFAGWHNLYSIPSITPNWVIQALFAFILPLTAINILISIFQKEKEGKDNFKKLQKLKNNPNIFNALLKKEKEVSIIPANLGLTFGNPNAKYKIIKVCNPYCGPCASAHQPLEKLLHNNDDLQVQILFTATNEKNDIKGPPVKHFLALAEKYGEETLKQALDDWYLGEVQDYAVFSSKHPMEEELNQQDQKIDMMKNWCDKIKIDFTPTFFISMSEDDDQSTKYFQMPGLYNVNDFKHFFLK